MYLIGILHCTRKWPVWHVHASVGKNVCQDDGRRESSNPKQVCWACCIHCLVTDMSVLRYCSQWLDSLVHVTEAWVSVSDNSVISTTGVQRTGCTHRKLRCFLPLKRPFSPSPGSFVFMWEIHVMIILVATCTSYLFFAVQKHVGYHQRRHLQLFHKFYAWFSDKKNPRK